MSRQIPMLLVCVVLLVAATVQAQCIDYGDYMHWVSGEDTPGSAADVAIDGDRAYVADGSAGLQVIDITNPLTPTLIGSATVEEGANGVAAQGNYAYVVYSVSDWPNDYSGLMVFDVTDPANPIQVGELLLDYLATEVEVQGNFAYVIWAYYPDAVPFSGLLVIDISDPTNPVVTGSEGISLWAEELVIEGDHAHVASSTDFFGAYTLIDISDPYQPQYTGGVGVGWEGGMNDIAVAGDLVCATGSGRFIMIDISDPDDMVELSEVWDYSPTVALTGGHAIIGERSFDISDPTDPQLAGRFHLPSNIRDVLIDGQYAYFVNAGSGLQVVDVTNPVNPAPLGSIDTGDLALDVAFADDLAYVAGGYDPGLQIFDVTDPANPIFLSSIDTPNRGYFVAVEGDLAFVTTTETEWEGPMEGVQIVDVADPGNPTLLGYAMTMYYVRDLDVAGDYLFAATDYLGLQVFDISDPLNPVSVALLDTGLENHGITLQGNHAYVASSSGLQIVDITDPENPSIVGSESLGTTGHDVDVSGALACVSSGNDEYQVRVFDVSDPSDPQQVGAVQLPARVEELTMLGSILYATASDHLWVINIANPGTPTLVGSGKLDYFGKGLDVGNDAVLIAQSGHGLISMPLQCVITAAPEQVASAPTTRLDAWPNPANPQLTVSFTLREQGAVQLTVHDVTGRLITRLAQGHFEAGRHDLIWRGEDLNGRPVVSGVYFARLNLGGDAVSRKLVLLR